MDSQSFNYWISQGHYIPQQPAHTGLYDVPPDMSKVPSLSGSPVSLTPTDIVTTVVDVFRNHRHMISSPHLYTRTTTLTLLTKPHTSDHIDYR
jgi:hypothetical protein